jgi:ATP-dependent 26S proteasome regulatory subunit
LRSAVASWGNLSHGELINALSAVLNLPAQAVGLACQPHSALLRCGLIRVNQHDGPLQELLKAPRLLSQRIPFHQDAPGLILAHLVLPLVAPGLQLADFNYMRRDTQLAQCWLAGALGAAARGERAGHLLVSGAPGLGKTEWVRALLTDAQTQAMELAVLLQDGTPLSGEERLSHLRLAMSLLRNTARGVIVFDEADDVFRGSDEFADGDKQAVTMVNHRASLNRLIEDSQVPVIWIMNHPDVLDAAVLRRFDTVIAFDRVPRSVRLSLLSARGDWGTEQIRLWADIPTLTPALIDRLAVVQERAQAAGQTMDADLCSHWLRHRLPGKATRHLGPARQSPGGPGSSGGPGHRLWQAQYVNASEDLLALAHGIRGVGSARILLYGPPGTGKTAYVHALARMLDRPLSEQRASDLLSPFVGETEQRISHAFESALDEDAVLFIDEADSLLANRERAGRHWEVSQVNEMLENLGDFQGVLVLATNRMEALDGAVLRRMDAKIRFDALTPQQARASFAALCQQLGLRYQECDAQEVARLQGLTPGDFACVARRLAFAPLGREQACASAASSSSSASSSSPASALVALLAEEVRLKAQGRQPIGFNP